LREGKDDVISQRGSKVELPLRGAFSTVPVRPAPLSALPRRRNIRVLLSKSSQRRLILTRRISSIASHPNNSKALFWNPGGAT
jgi:hypothetical protein